MARRFRRTAAALAALLALGASADDPLAAETAQVRIENFHFVPETLEVGAGATVTWANADEEIHTITSSEGLFKSPALDGEQRFSHRFDKPGIYTYGCALHPQMKGTIVVR